MLKGNFNAPLQLNGAIFFQVFWDQIKHDPLYFEIFALPTFTLTSHRLSHCVDMLENELTQRFLKLAFSNNYSNLNKNISSPVCHHWNWTDVLCTIKVFSKLYPRTISSIVEVFRHSLTLHWYKAFGFSFTVNSYEPPMNELEFPFGNHICLYRIYFTKTGYGKSKFNYLICFKHDSSTKISKIINLK